MHHGYMWALPMDPQSDPKWGSTFTPLWDPSAGVLPYLLLAGSQVPALRSLWIAEREAGVELRGSVSVTTVSFADVLYWCRHEPCPLLCSCHSHQKLHQPLGELGERGKIMKLSWMGMDCRFQVWFLLSIWMCSLLYQHSAKQSVTEFACLCGQD